MSITFAANGTRISNWMQDITTEFTMSTWVKTTSSTSTLVIFETSTNYNFTNGAWIFFVSPASGGGQISYSIGGASVHAANLTAAEVGAWNDGNWHHWVISGRRNSGDTGAESWRVWFDGTQITLSTAATNASSANFANQTMHISARALTALDFVGSHSDIALWNFFDPDDNFVKSLYYGACPMHIRPDALKRYLPLREDSDQTKSTGDDNGAQEVIVGANRLYYGNYTWDDDEPHLKVQAPVIGVNSGGSSDPCVYHLVTGTPPQVIKVNGICYTLNGAVVDTGQARVTPEGTFNSCVECNLGVSSLLPSPSPQAIITESSPFPQSSP